MSARHAIYFAPAVDSAWWRFGAGWLGWDEVRGEALPQPVLPEFPRETFHALTSEPRRYGFHATLKAPMRLREGVDESVLYARLDTLVSHLRGVPLGPLVPQRLGGFVALVPQERQPAIDAVAARCVMDLDDLRAPPTPEEIARRATEQLDPRQRELLERYGYPHVLGHFRFHMTLSKRVDPAIASVLLQRASEQVAPLNEHHPLRLDRLCVFREDHPGAPFLRVHERELTE